MSFDDIGDRMKAYETAGVAGQRLMPMLPAFARLDGKSFHNLTRHMDRPFDVSFHCLMDDVTLNLAQETNARLAYTQSDEITLFWYEPNWKTQIYFDGRVAKLTSVLASMATWFFTSRWPTWFHHTIPRPPLFDCRVWNVPSLDEAANVFLWRELDATRNSIEMAAQSVYSHQQLFRKGQKEMQEMLLAKGINWNDYSARCKRGSYVRRRVFKRPFSAQEIEKLPPQHDARFNPALEVERASFDFWEFPPMPRIENRRNVLMGDDPVIETELDES